MTDAPDVEQAPPTAAASPGAPRNPYVVALVVLDIAAVVLAACLFLTAAASASQAAAGVASGDAGRGELAAAGWCFDAAGLITLLLIAIAAVRWRPPGE